MNRLILQIRSQFRKGKGQTIAFLIIMVIASALLCTGLVVWRNFDSAFDKKCVELNSADIVCALPSKECGRDLLSYVVDIGGVTKAENRNCMYAYCNYDYADAKQSSNIVLLSSAVIPKIGDISFVEKSQEDLEHDEICLPVIFMYGGGYELGDDFVLTIGDDEYTYSVGGFFEEMMLGSLNAGIMMFQLDDKAYKDLESSTDNMLTGSLVMIQTEDSANLNKITLDVSEYISDEYPEVAGATVVNSTYIKNSRSFSASIISAIIFAVAVVVIIVGTIVIKFRVDNCVTEYITEYGVLKATGYTSGQIRTVIVLQFTIIAILSCGLGLVLACLLLPEVAKLQSAQSGMVWVQGIEGASSAMTFGLIMISSILASLYASRKIHVVQPVAALTGQTDQRTTKRNYLMLEKSRGPLNFTMAIKMFLQNAKLNFSVAIMILAVSFASLFTMVLFYNAVIDNSNFVNVVAGMTADVYLQLDPTQNNGFKENPTKFEGVDYEKEVQEIDGVDDAVYFGYRNAAINGTSIVLYVCDDFDRIDSVMCYEGNDPTSKFEIALGGVLAELLGVGIGDKVEVNLGSRSSLYEVTGLIQSGNQSGYDCEMSILGFERLNSNYIPCELYVYLDEDTSPDDFISRAENQYGKELESSVDYMKNIDAKITIYEKILFTVAVGIYVIVFLTILLIIYMVVKTVVEKHTVDFGIQKAFGYTNRQLENQLSLSLLPIVIVGSVVGSIIGFFSTNYIMTMLLSSIGIMKMRFTLFYSMMVINTIVICVFSYIVSLLISRRIRRIAPVSLINSI